MSNRASRRRELNIRRNTLHRKQMALRFPLLRSQLATWVFTVFAFCLALGGVFALSGQNSAKTPKNLDVSLPSLLFAKQYIAPIKPPLLTLQPRSKHQPIIATLPYHEPSTKNIPLESYTWRQANTVTATRPILQQSASATNVGMPNPYLFAGQQWDPASQTYYLRARYYNPPDGRFLSPDPLAGRNQDPVSLHRYLYAHDEPTDRVDPSGEADDTLVGAGISNTTAAGLAALGASSSLLAGQYIRQNGLPEIYLQQQPTTYSPSSAINQVAAQTLPDLTGKTREEAEQALNDAGFIEGNTSAGGYARWRNPDGSDVYIRPDGEIIRLGPKVTPTGGGKSYHPHYDSEGQITQEHNTGEIVSDNPAPEAPDNGDIPNP